MRLVPRTRVGRYEVVALLGTGGMANVYRAKDTRLGREVAIEVVSEALGADQPVVGVEHSAISTCSTGWFRLAAEQGGRAAEEST